MEGAVAMRASHLLAALFSGAAFPDELRPPAMEGVHRSREQRLHYVGAETVARSDAHYLECAERKRLRRANLRVGAARAGR